MFLGSNEDAHLGALINSSHVARLFRPLGPSFRNVSSTIITVFYFSSARIRRFLSSLAKVNSCSSIHRHDNEQTITRTTCSQISRRISRSTYGRLSINDIRNKEGGFRLIRRLVDQGGPQVCRCCVSRVVRLRPKHAGTRRIVSRTTRPRF